MFLFSTVSFANASATELERMRFDDASQYYAKAEYTKAITVYNELMLNGVQSANLYFNLSNAYWAVGRRGEALWAGYQAQRVGPRDIEIRNHIDELQKELNKPKIPELFFKENILNHIASYISQQELVISILLISFILGVWLLAATFFKFFRVLLIRGATFWVIAGALVSVLIFSKYNLNRIPHAIIVSTVASVRYAAGDKNSEAEKLVSGAHVRVLKTASGWSHVAYKNKQTGWVLTDAMRIVQ